MRHFISNRPKTLGKSVTPPLLITITQHRFMVKKIVFAISQLRLVGSHNTSLGSVAHSTWQLDDLKIRKCHFLSDPCVFGYIFYEKEPIETFYISS